MELRGSSKRKKSAATRRIPPRVREEEGGGKEEGERKGEEDVTRELPNPALALKVEEVPQTISREGKSGGLVCVISPLTSLTILTHSHTHYL